MKISLAVPLLLLVFTSAGATAKTAGQFGSVEDWQGENLLARSCGYTLSRSKLPKSILATVIQLVPGDVRPSDAREIKETVEAIARAGNSPGTRTRLEARLQRVKEEAEQGRPVLVRLDSYIPASAVGILAHSSNINWDDARSRRDGRKAVMAQREPPADFASADLGVVVRASAVADILAGDLVRVRARNWELSPDQARVAELLVVEGGEFDSYVPLLAGLSTRAALRPAGENDKAPAKVAPLLVRDATSPLIPATTATGITFTREGEMENLGAFLRYAQLAKPGLANQLSGMVWFESLVEDSPIYELGGPPDTNGRAVLPNLVRNLTAGLKIRGSRQGYSADVIVLSLVR